MRAAGDKVGLKKKNTDVPDVALERRRKTSPLGSCSCNSTTIPGSSGGHRAGPFPSPTSTVHGERECQVEDAHPRVGWRVPEVGQLPFLLWGLQSVPVIYRLWNRVSAPDLHLVSPHSAQKDTEALLGDRSTPEV